VPGGAQGTLKLSDVPGGGSASPSQSGLLLLYRDAKANQESQAIILEHGKGQGGRH
jgi:hypothetical protein